MTSGDGGVALVGVLENGVLWRRQGARVRYSV